MRSLGRQRIVVLVLSVLVTSAGSAELLASVRPKHLLRGADGAARFGEAIDGVGDVDGDGVTDFGISSPAEQNGRGAVRVYSGARLLAQGRRATNR